MLLSNRENIGVLSLLPKKIKVLVLKFVVKFKSGLRNFIQISDLYQSCGMSLFRLSCLNQICVYMITMEKVSYDHVCVRSGPGTIRPVPGILQI